MNILVTEEQCEELLRNSMFHVEFGTQGGSDIDRIYFITPNTTMDASILKTEHKLFYKDKAMNSDFLFVTPRGFIHSLFYGTDALSYDIVADGLLKGTSLEWLNPEMFHTYQTVKSLVGVARKDLKDINRLEGRAGGKKFKFALKGLERVVNIMRRWLLTSPSNNWENRELMHSVLLELRNEAGVLTKVGGMLKVPSLDVLNLCEEKLLTYGDVKDIMQLRNTGLTEQIFNGVPQ